MPFLAYKKVQLFGEDRKGEGNEIEISAGLDVDWFFETYSEH